MAKASQATEAVAGEMSVHATVVEPKAAAEAELVGYGHREGGAAAAKARAGAARAGAARVRPTAAVQRGQWATAVAAMARVAMDMVVAACWAMAAAEGRALVMVMAEPLTVAARALQAAKS